MSKTGAPKIALGEVGAGKKIAIVAASWHTEIMDGLIAGAKRALVAAGASYDLIRVPGSFELPVACARLAASEKYHALVALGVVIRGGTPHFDYVCQAATQGLTAVSLEYLLPVGFGVLTCDDEAQARDRAGYPDSSEDKGAEAANAVLATLVTLDSQ